MCKWRCKLAMLFFATFLDKKGAAYVLHCYGVFTRKRYAHCTEVQCKSISIIINKGQQYPEVNVS